jgi:hypothetical protein
MFMEGNVVHGILGESLREVNIIYGRNNIN